MSSEDGTIHRVDLAERLRHFTMTTYLSTSDLLCAGVTALAAGVALEIVSAPHPEPLRILLWVTSLGVFVSFHALWRLGSLFSSWSSGALDYVAPLLLGLFEFAQFIVLSGQFHAADWATTWLWMVVGQVTMAAVFVNNRLHHLNAQGQYAADSLSFVGAYREFMRQGRLGAGLWAIALIALVAAGLLLGGAWSGRLTIAAAVISCLIGLVSLQASVRFQREFQALLFDPPDDGAASA